MPDDPYAHDDIGADSEDVLARLRLRAYLADHGGRPEGGRASKKPRRGPGTRWQISVRTALGALACVAVTVAAAIMWGSSREASNTVIGAKAASHPSTAASASAALGTSAPRASASPTAPTTQGTEGAARPGIRPDGKVDVNVATAKELEQLPGIGPALAGRIVEYRGAHGSFRSVDALGNVKGIGAAKLAALRAKAAV